jgi:hypothetical protein
LAQTIKNDALRNPIPKRKRVWVPAASRGFELAVNDPTLAVKVRRGALLKVKNPTKTFLARLVLDPDTPGLLRLAASERLEEIQEEPKARRGPTRAQAERTAKELLARIRGKQAQPASDTTLSEGKEPSAKAVLVFDGLD